MALLSNDELSASSVPADMQARVDRLRNFLQDTAELNDLEAVEESTDIELYYALQDTFSEMNYEVEPTDLSFEKISDIPWAILKLGAVLNILVSKGILSARNVLSYNDSGGITVKDQDKYGRYTVFFNMLTNKYRRAAMGFKRSYNLNGGYGGSHSEYDNFS